jgi:flagellin-like protein
MLHDKLSQREERESERAVSPVIGVILMVAITVILAAVIGAFVLEIGDQQETAPNTSFDTEQADYQLQNRNSPIVNLTQVEITHSGGAVLDRDSVTLKVDGNSSTYDFQQQLVGFQSETGTVPALQVFRGDGDKWSGKTENYPYTEEFTSGQTARIRGYGLG